MIRVNIGIGFWPWDSFVPTCGGNVSSDINTIFSILTPILLKKLIGHISAVAHRMNLDNIPYPSPADGVDLSLTELSEIEKIFFEYVEKYVTFSPRAGNILCWELLRIVWS